MPIESSFSTVLNCCFLPLLILAPAANTGFRVGTQETTRNVAQDVPGGVAQALANHRRFLVRSPYHEAVFEQLVERLTLSGALDAVVAEYEREHAAHPEERSTTVVLARLCGAQGEARRALELIGELAFGSEQGSGDARLLFLRAQFLLIDGQRTSAIGVLGEAADNSEPGAFQQKVLELRATVQLAAGDRAGARTSLMRLAADAGDREHHMQAAELLSRSGFAEEAAAEFRITAEVDTDPQHRSEALVAQGRELERLTRSADAGQVYLEALALLAHDHWLARDLRTRILLLHERSGRLPELVTRYRRTLVERPTDRGVHEALAGALERSGLRDQALEVLAAAVERFPEDRMLSRARLDTARRARATEQVIAEYQRLLARRPEDAELRFELGEEFAAMERLEQAIEQWTQLLARHPNDPGLTRRVAQRWIVHGRPERARELFERAVGQDPGEVERYADLAVFLRANGETQAALEWLQRGEQALSDSPGALDRLSDLFLEQGHSLPALQALQASLALDPSVSQRRYRLARLQFREGRVEEGLSSLRLVALHARELELSDLAARDFARRHNFEDAKREAKDLSRTLVTPESVAARLLVIALQQRGRDDVAVQAGFAALFVAHPEDFRSRLWCASWLVEQDRTVDALEIYAWLERRLPERALEFLFERASLHLERKERKEAAACLETAYTNASADPVIGALIAHRMAETSRAFRAAEMWEDVLRMPRADPAGHLEVALLYQGMTRVDAARRHLMAAWLAPETAIREKAAGLLLGLLRRTGGVNTLLAELDTRLAANPFDLSSALLACELLYRDGRGTEALARVKSLLDLSPHEASLLRQRAHILLSLGRPREAMGDLETLRSTGTVPGPDMVEAILAAGGLTEAVQLASQLEESLGVLSLFAEHPEGARALLEIMAARPSPPPRVFLQLAALYEESEHFSAAIRALERHREREPGDWRMDLRIAKLRGRNGEHVAALAEGRRLLVAGVEHSVVRQLYVQLNATKQFYLVLAEEVLRHPADEDRIRGYLATLQIERQCRIGTKTLRDLRVKVISSGRVPKGHTLESWTRWIAGAEFAFFREAPNDARRRRKRLRDLVGESLDGEKHCSDLLHLLALKGGFRDGDLPLVEKITARYPHSPVVLTAAGRALESDGHWEAAERVYADLLVVLREPKNERETRLAEARAWSRHVAVREPALRSEGIQGREVLDVALRLSFGAETGTTWWPDMVLTPTRTQWRRGLCLAFLERREEAAELLSDDSVDPRYPFQRLELLGTLIAAGMLPGACVQLVTVLRLNRRLLHEPPLSSTSLPNILKPALAEALSAFHRQGHTHWAYDAMRTGGFVPEARQYLHRKRNHRAVAAYYTVQLKSARFLFDAADGQNILSRERSLRLVHDLTIKLAEVHRERGRDGAGQAESLWIALERLHPGDLAVLARKARTAEWNNAWVNAAAHHQELVLARAALADLRPALRRIWSSQLLTPANPPPVAVGREAGWQALRAQARSGGILDPTADWLGIVYAKLMQSDHEGAARAVDELLTLSTRWRLQDTDIEELLAAEDFGALGGHVRESLARWRLEHAPADDR